MSSINHPELFIVREINDFWYNELHTIWVLIVKEPPAKLRLKEGLAGDVEPWCQQKMSLHNKSSWLQKLPLSNLIDNKIIPLILEIIVQFSVWGGKKRIIDLWREGAQRTEALWEEKRLLTKQLSHRSPSPIGAAAETSPVWRTVCHRATTINEMNSVAHIFPCVMGLNYQGSSVSSLLFRFRSRNVAEPNTIKAPCRAAWLNALTTAAWK